MQPDIAHSSYDQLTAVKTGYSLISITCSGIEPSSIFWKLSADNLLVFKWLQAKVHFRKCISKLSRTIKIVISNWLKTQIQLAITGKARKEVLFDFSHHGHVLVTLSVQFLFSDWSKFDRWVHAEKFMQHLESCLLSQLKLTEFCVNLWCF